MIKIKERQKKKMSPYRVWWYMSVIPALGRPSQEHCEFEYSLDHILMLSQKTQNQNN
jgi:hypothetical protein